MPSSTALCYVKGTDTRFGGYGPGVHLTSNGRRTLCDLPVRETVNVGGGDDE